jgi:hypothetical protein
MAFCAAARDCHIHQMRPAGHAIRLCEKWQVTTAFPTGKNGEMAAASDSAKTR